MLLTSGVEGWYVGEWRFEGFGSFVGSVFGEVCVCGEDDGTYVVVLYQQRCMKQEDMVGIFLNKEDGGKKKRFICCDVCYAMM